MTVFIPHKKDFNIYFDEIINKSSFNFVFGNFKEFKSSYSIVNIQFPEAIFDWNVPSKRQLVELETCLKEWKKSTKIVYTLNDFKSHYDTKNEFQDVFNLIQHYADGVIHLGNYSLKNYTSFFPADARHAVIYHPLYESLKVLKTKDVSEKFNAEYNNKFIVSAIGNIRSMEEAKHLLKIFKKIERKDKILIVPKMFNFFKLPKYLPYRFRHIYRSLIEFWYCFPLKKEQYHFGFSFIEYPMMVDLLKKSSLMIIPRLKSLNSGLLFLGLTFDKPMLIPKIGNLTEVAHLFGLPLFDISKNKLNIDLEDFQKKYKSSEYLEKKKAFLPEIIAQQYQQFFEQISDK